MKIFVINLERRTDRKAFMETQLKKFAIEAEFIEAVDGTNLTPEEAALYDKEQALAHNGKVLSPGELGCALSHRKIYEKMLREHIPEVLILEDDVRLTKEFAALLSNQKVLESKEWNWLHVDYPLIHIGDWIRSSIVQTMHNPFFAFYASLKFPYILVLSVYERLRNKTASPSHPYIAYFARPLYFTGCYFVTTSAAKILLNLATPVIYPADRLPNQARLKAGFRMRAVVPVLVRQDRENLLSDIDLPL